MNFDLFIKSLNLVQYVHSVHINAIITHKVAKKKKIHKNTLLMAFVMLVCILQNGVWAVPHPGAAILNLVLAHAMDL